MTENLFACRCGFKCVESQTAKTDGYCPKCGLGRPDLTQKYDRNKMTQKVN